MFSVVNYSDVTYYTSLSQGGERGGGTYALREADRHPEYSSENTCDFEEIRKLI